LKLVRHVTSAITVAPVLKKQLGALFSSYIYLELDFHLQIKTFCFSLV